MDSSATRKYRKNLTEQLLVDTSTGSKLHVDAARKLAELATTMTGYNELTSRQETVGLDSETVEALRRIQVSIRFSSLPTTPRVIPSSVTHISFSSSPTTPTRCG